MGRTRLDAICAAWRSRASDLAEWAEAHLVNRQDVWGAYRALAERGRSYTLRDGARRTLGVSYTRHATDDRRGGFGLWFGDLVAHFRVRDDVGCLIGLHTTAEDGTCRWGAVECDIHGGDDGTTAAAIQAAIRAWHRRLTDLGITALATGSNGRGGCHLRVLLAEPISSEEMYAFLGWLTADYASYGLDRPPERFPKQPRLDPVSCQYGNWLRLPGRHHTRPYWSEVWDGTRWLEGHAAVDHVLALVPSSPELLRAALPANWYEATLAARPLAAPARAAGDGHPRQGGGVTATDCARVLATPDVLERARAWAEAHDISVEGQNGSGALMRLLRGLWTGWALSESQVWEVIRPWNARCLPPWQDYEIAHKIRSVMMTPDPHGRPDGYMVSDWRADGQPLSREDMDLLYAGLRRRRPVAAPAAATAPAPGGASGRMHDFSDFAAPDGAAARSQVCDAEQLASAEPPSAEPYPERGECHRIKMRFRRGNERMVAGLPCQSWSCDICIDWQRARWGRRIRYHLRLLGDDATVYVGHVTPGCDWDSFRQAMCRARSCYASVLVERTRQRFVVATAPFGGAQAVTVEQAIRCVSEAIAALTTDCSSAAGHPVSCCRRWPWPCEAGEGETRAAEPWECLGRMADETNMDRAPAVLRSFAIRGREHFRDNRRYLTFSIPDGMAADDERMLWAALEAGQRRAEYLRARDELARLVARLNGRVPAGAGDDG